MLHTRFIASLCLLSLSLMPTLGHSQVKDYHFMKKTVVGGEGGWDFITADPINERLYIAHGAQVDLYDLEHDSIVGHIPHTEGVHGIAIADRDQHAFISCGKSNTVLMVDMRTGDTMKRIPVGEKPDAIIYDLATKHIFVMNAKSNDITLLESVSGDVVTTIKLTSNPEFAVSDESGHVYVNLEDAGKVVKINANFNTVEKVWSIGAGKGPTGIAMDRGSNRLFIGCANEMMLVMNADNGKILKQIKIGKGCDFVAFDPFTKYAFASCGDGTTTIVHEVTPKDFKVVQSLATQRGARTMALDPRSHFIYLPTAEFGPTPAATKENTNPRPSIIPGSFTILKYGP